MLRDHKKYRRRDRIVRAMRAFIEASKNEADPREWSRAVHPEGRDEGNTYRREAILARAFGVPLADHDSYVCIEPELWDKLAEQAQRLTAAQPCNPETVETFAESIFGRAQRWVIQAGVDNMVEYFKAAHDRSFEADKTAPGALLLRVPPAWWDFMQDVGERLEVLGLGNGWFPVTIALAFLRDEKTVAEVFDSQMVPRVASEKRRLEREARIAAVRSEHAGGGQ